MKFYVLPENALLELKIQDKSLKEMMHLSSLVNRQISFYYKLTFLQFLQGRYSYFESFLISQCLPRGILDPHLIKNGVLFDVKLR